MAMMVAGSPRRVVSPGNLLLLYFTVDWSPDVHRLADSRTLLRVADTNQPFPSEKIAALKALKTQGMYERSYPHGAGIEDLDLALVASVVAGIEPGMSPEAYLLARRLVEPRHDRLVPDLAGLLLFGRDPLRWHPRCYTQEVGTASAVEAIRRRTRAVKAAPSAPSAL